MIELGVAAVLFVLATALPRRPRDEQQAESEPAIAVAASVDSSTGRSGNPPAPDYPAEPEPVFASRYTSTENQ
jgi:hypothetical protein